MDFSEVQSNKHVIRDVFCSSFGTRRKGRVGGNMKPLRSHPNYWASILHRISGLALTAFIPIHLYVLSTALNGSNAFEQMIAFTDRPIVKAAEYLLLLLLVLHLLFGIRVLFLELSRSPNHNERFAKGFVPVITCSAIIGFLFIYRVLQ